MSHFFKIILCHAHQHKLELPVKFMCMYGKDLSSVMYINVPSGVEWSVRLLKQYGRAWLDEGWEEFAKFYSIDLGHFLLFKYDGNSRLHVIIFDMSACEIEYPTQTSNHGCEESPVLPLNDQTCKSEENNVDCLDHGITGQEDGRNSGICTGISSRSLTNYRDCITEERKANFLAHNIAEPDDMKSGGVSIKFLSTSPPTKKSKRVPRRGHKRKLMRDSLDRDGADAGLLPRKIVMALQSERKSELPTDRDGAHAGLLPRKIVMALQSERKSEERKHVGRLKRIEPNKPNVVSSAHPRPVGRPPAKYNAAAHWRPVGSPPVKRNAEGSSATAVDASRRHASVYPSFKLVMSHCYLMRSPFLPREFVRKNINGSSRSIQLQVSGRSWPLWMAKFKKNNLCKFSTGWRAFVRENNLSVGDVCIFQLVKSELFHLQRRHPQMLKGPMRGKEVD
ncbi:B3 domain-containing protein [Drosera capensis]